MRVLAQCCLQPPLFQLQLASRCVRRFTRIVADATSGAPVRYYTILPFASRHSPLAISAFSVLHYGVLHYDILPSAS